MKTRLFARLSLLAVLACTCTAIAAPPGPSAREMGRMDEVAKAVSLRPLRSAALGKDEKEIRIWTGFDFFPSTLVRIVVKSDGIVQGSAYRYYRAEDMKDKSPEGLELYADTTKNCSPAGIQGPMEACRRTGLSPQAFTKAYALLDGKDIDIWQLPDESLANVPRLPGDPQIVDGYGFRVELKAGDAYHTIFWSNPAFKRGPIAARADAISTALRETIFQRPPEKTP